MIEAAQDALRRTERHSTLSSNPNYVLLIKSTVAKANGVFLWLQLALRHLVRGIDSAYSILQLAELLDFIPGDVSAMSQKMLDKLLARPDRVRVAITLLILSDPARQRGGGHYVMYFSAMDDVLDGSIKLEDLLRDSPGERYSPDQVEKRLIDTEARLRAVCFVGRHIPGHQLKSVPVWRIGPDVYAASEMEQHVSKLFDKEHGNWHYLTLAQLIELVAPHPKKKAVMDLLYAKSPWAVSRWVSQAAASLREMGSAAGSGPSPSISKLELAQLGTCYFFVSMIVEEHELKSVEIPGSARDRLLATDLIPI